MHVYTCTCRYVYTHVHVHMITYCALFVQRGSPNLCELIGSGEFSELARLREEEVRLFQCFLDTRLMLCRPENPNPLRADEEVLELVPGGGHRRKQPSARVKPVDPLHQLFLPDDPRTVGGLSCVPHVPAYIMDAQIFYIHVYIIIYIYICVCNVSPCTMYVYIHMYVSCTLHGPIQFQNYFM